MLVDKLNELATEYTKLARAAGNNALMGWLDSELAELNGEYDNIDLVRVTSERVMARIAELRSKTQ